MPWRRLIPRVMRREPDVPLLAPPPPPLRPLLAALAGLGALFAALALLRGGDPAVVLYPAAAVLIVAAIVAAQRPQPPRLSGGAPGIALAALAGLAAWTAISLAWSPDPGLGAEEAAHLAAAAAAFALGLLALDALRGRPLLLTAPVLVAGAIVSIVTLVVIGVGWEIGLYLESDATLEWPMPYRGATAGFFSASFLAATAVACVARLDWRLRGALIGVGALGFQLAVLAQSRAATLGTVAALLVLFALHPTRLRLAAHLALAVVPTLPALPALLAVFGDPSELTPVVAHLLHDAALAAALAGAAAAAVGAVAARSDARLRPSPVLRRRIERGALLGGSALAAIGLVGFVAAVGNPVSWLGDRASDFAEGNSSSHHGNVRVISSVDSNRSDFWRVALDDGVAEPLTGRGAGGFGESYRERGDSDERPTDPHGIGFDVLSELGLPGLLLLLTWLGASAWGLREARRRRPSWAAAIAIAAAVATLWLAMAAVDRAWVLPAVTVPVAWLVGAACGPAAFPPRPWERGGTR